MGQGLQELPEWVNAISEQIVLAAIEVHRALGPGLLERIYEEALVHELKLRGLRVEQQVPVTFVYKGKELVGQRIDLVVEGTVVLELKSVEAMVDVYYAQMQGYLRAGGYPLGLLMNFNVPVLKSHIHRRINSRAIATLVEPKRLVSSSASSA